MKVVPLFLLIMLAAPLTNHAQTRLKYPDVRKSDHKDVLHGATIPDPYRWLEDENAAETRAFVQTQSAFTRRYLDALPGRAAIAKRITELTSYPQYGFNEAPAGVVRRASRYFHYRRDPGRQQFSLYMRLSLDGPEKLVLDADALSADGTASLVAWDVSPDGRWLAYGISRGGSDWREVRVRDLDAGKEIADLLQWVKFSWPVWTPDSKGFYYSRYPAPAKGEELSAKNLNHAVYYHRIGTPQSDDKLVWSRPDHPDWVLNAFPADHGRRVVFAVFSGSYSTNRIFAQDATKPGSPVVELAEGLAGLYNFIESKGSKAFFTSTAGAPRGRIVSFDLARPAEPPREVVAESADTLETVELDGELLFASYNHDVKNVVRVYSLDGKPAGEVELPGPGTVSFGSNSIGADGSEFFYSFTGFTTPGAVYRYDVGKKQSRAISAPHPHFNPAGLAVEQVFYPSKDGAKIPMYLFMKKGLKRDGSNPVLLFGYGGFNVATMPSFSSAFVAFAEQGGIVAVANLRGGSEYGESWHKAGMREKKQNVFDDFIAAAEWLIANKYTRKEKLAIRGGSNGGLLVGAVLNQRPDLFGAAVPMVGVMDMLRFHKFTIGGAWADEYGSPDDSKDFAVIKAYSPLHNIRKGAVYPPTLVTTADHDDRVVPAHSFKYASALQAAQEGPAPILLRIETSAGHGAGISRSKAVELETDILAFLHKALDF